MIFASGAERGTPVRRRTLEPQSRPVCSCSKKPRCYSGYVKMSGKRRAWSDVLLPLDMTAMIQSLSSEFQGEIKSKQDALDLTQAHLRAATRELSEQRKQIQLWQVRCGELEQIDQRIRNVDKALVEEDQFDWTGRTDLDGKDAKGSAGPAFQWRGTKSTMVGIGGSVDISFAVDSEPPVPMMDSAASLVKLRRLKLWHQRMEDLVQERLKGLQGASAEKEYQCKKIVALCTGIPLDKVEDVSDPLPHSHITKAVPPFSSQMLENLVIAVESEAQVVDIGRVSGFMQKVNYPRSTRIRLSVRG